MDLVGVRVEIPANTPMVLLREQTGANRLVPIYIGTAEASAIHYALEGIEPPRPLTHDLFMSVIELLGASLERVVITEVIDHTYYAELRLVTAAGDRSISARPSDAIALAVRCDAPIYAAEALLDEVGQVPEPEPEEAAEEIIHEFKDFIDNVSPEDFAG
jgi:bifunctional DNase/RNase